MTPALGGMVRRRIFWPLLLTLITVSSGQALAGSLPAGIRIITAEEVLSERAEPGPDGQLYFRDLQGTLRRFVTSIDDPLILNPGDGEFHPLAVEHVEDALLAVDGRFLASLQFEVYVLPYPVASPLTSWANGGTIYLSPGVYELSLQQVHQLVVHELGHVLHQIRLPDENLLGWDLYRSIRGITDTLRYSEESQHRDRPHEIFAEDFRVLFGGDLARNGGSIENADLASPEGIADLPPFFLDLVSAPLETLASSVARFSPNPAVRGGQLRLSLPGSTGPIELKLFDVAGREVRVVRNFADRGAGRYEMIWDALDSEGRALPHGVYFGSARSLASGDSAPFRVRLIQ